MAMDIFQIMAAEKTLALRPDWVAEDRNSLQLASPLDIGGVTVEGAQLRMTALRIRPDENVVVQLEFKRKWVKFRPACRVEWRPIHSHSNNGLGPREYRFKQITGSHHHPFEFNCNPLTGEIKPGNLNVAVPIIPDPPDFQSFLAFVGVTLRARPGSLRCH